MPNRATSAHQRHILSIGQQWKLADQFREALILSAGKLPQSTNWETVSAPNAVSPDAWAAVDIDWAEIGRPNQRLADLEHAWRAAVSQSQIPPLLADRDGFSKGKIANTPIEVICIFLGYGLFPPPELLLVVRHTFEAYFDRAGAAELEETFFRNRKQHVGNYAARRAASSEEFRWAFDIASSSKSAGGDLKAAERIKERENLDIEAESILRRARKRWKKAPKPEQ
jgi:hypothetical protein